MLTGVGVSGSKPIPEEHVSFQMERWGSSEGCIEARMLGRVQG